MYVFPIIIFLKGPICNELELRRLLQDHDSLSGLNLLEYLEQSGVDIKELANKQLICFGEGNSGETFKLIMVENFDKHTSVVVRNAHNFNTDALTNFFSNTVKPA